MRLHRSGRVVLKNVCLLAGLLLCRPAQAIWMRPEEPVPVKRLLANVERYVREHPKDARGYYTLGRLHSLAFAQDNPRVGVYTKLPDQPKGLVSFPPFESVRVKRQKQKPPDKSALKHLNESVRYYRRATELDKTDETAFLGLGWMLEQGHLLGRAAGSPPPGNKAGDSSWRGQALAAYRAAYRLGKAQDHAGLMGTDIVAIEAAAGVERLQKGQRLTRTEQGELAEMRVTVKKIQETPRPITPIVFPLNGRLPLRQLLSKRTVSFDIAGNGLKRRWPWIQPNAGLLVWDPLKTGRVTSGRQLFGSVTWWMFWRDGYQPLAALDNDSNGWLSGPELAGIAVWRDTNGNGISEPGEVIPARQFGVARIATRATGRQDGALSNPAGIQMQGGTSLPTYDWTPTSLPASRG